MEQRRKEPALEAIRTGPFAGRIDFLRQNRYMQWVRRPGVRVGRLKLDSPDVWRVKMRRIVTHCLMWSLLPAVAISFAGCASVGNRASDAKGKSAGSQRDATAPKAGDRAPVFTLKMLDDETKRVKLASFRGKKPVVLFFGSYT